MDKKNELPPTCELANLRTCQLAYLLTCLLANLPTILAMLSRRASRLPSRSCSCRHIVPPFRPVLIVSSSRQAIRRAGRFFSSVRLIHRARIHPRPAPFSQAHSCRRLVVSSRPSSRWAYRHFSSRPSFYSSWGIGDKRRSKEHGVLYNAIFCYLTFQMLNTKK